MRCADLHARAKLTRVNHRRGVDRLIPARHEVHPHRALAVHGRLQMQNRVSPAQFAFDYLRAANRLNVRPDERLLYRVHQLDGAPRREHPVLTLIDQRIQLGHPVGPGLPRLQHLVDSHERLGLHRQQRADADARTLRPTQRHDEFARVRVEPERQRGVGNDNLEGQCVGPIDLGSRIVHVAKPGRRGGGIEFLAVEGDQMNPAPVNAVGAFDLQGHADGPRIGQVGQCEAVHCDGISRFHIGCRRLAVRGLGFVQRVDRRGRLARFDHLDLVKGAVLADQELVLAAIDAARRGIEKAVRLGEALGAAWRYDPAACGGGLCRTVRPVECLIERSNGDAAIDSPSRGVSTLSGLAAANAKPGDSIGSCRRYTTLLLEASVGCTSAGENGTELPARSTTRARRRARSAGSAASPRAAQKLP
jgi:hypothetical protein